jgi:hypothetical protein
MGKYDENEVVPDLAAPININSGLGMSGSNLKSGSSMLGKVLLKKCLVIMVVLYCLKAIV